MNFLELCQTLRQECSISGYGPITVEEQTGEYARVVSWIRQANQELQSRYFNWKFLFRQISVVLPDAEGAPVAQFPPEDLNQWLTTSLEINGEPLPTVEYFQKQKRLNDSVYALLMPDNSLMIFNTKPGDVLTGDYYAAPQILKENNDKPFIPEPYHWLIIYRAMMFYANYDNAPELKQTAIEGMQQLMPQLEASQLPGQSVGMMVNENHFVVTPQ